MKKMRSIAIILALGAVMMSTMQSCYRIDAGHVGLKVNLYGTDKGVSDVVEVTGFDFYAPWSSQIVEFPVFSQTKDYDPFNITAKDASVFSVDPTLTYFVESEHAPHIYRQYRKPLESLENGILKNLVYDAYRITANNYTSDSLMANRGAFELQLQQTLSSTMKEEGFTFQQLTSQLTPPNSLAEAINQKNLAVQQSLQAKNLVEKERMQADIATAKARGVADAKKIEADGIYYYNQRVQESLSSQLLQQMWIEKWNGTMPTVTSGGSGTMMMINPNTK